MNAKNANTERCLQPPFLKQLGIDLVRPDISRISVSMMDEQWYYPCTLRPSIGLAQVL
jgi:hypothetical protein